MEKKFQSIVRRVVLLPMLAMALIVCIMLVSCTIGFLNMRQQMIDSSLSSLQVSQSQLENLLNQIDHTFVEYWNSNMSYAFLKSFNRNTPREEYLIHESDTLTWMRNLSNAYEEVQGTFVYYENIGNFLFRGTTNQQVNSYIKACIQNGHSQYNCWQLATINERQYVINIKKYNHFFGGVWIPVDTLLANLQLDSANYHGTVYLIDKNNYNTLSDASLRQSLKKYGSEVSHLKTGNDIIYNYLTNATQDNLFIGLLIPRLSLFTDMPFFYKAIFVLAVCSILLIPVVVLWLRSKIALPVKAMDDAMRLIGEGNTDYRIPLPEKKTFDEFDRLFVRFNQMMDELNELEFTLYKTKLKEQQTELRYISQQIRPHFILNALNIIYTCDKTEFPLIRKMVLHLTEYFRYIVNLRVDFVEVEQELRHVENYLNIQKERYLERFDFFVEWEIAVQGILIPPLIIQTFVENCIKYGINGCSKTFIYVLASRSKDSLHLMIADTGNGFSDDMLARIRRFIDTRSHQEGLGTGIENAIERMDILYKKEIDIQLKNALSGGAVVELHLPALSAVPAEQED